jgi:hypothetical protein
MATYLEAIRTSKEVQDAQATELKAREAAATSLIAVVRVEGALSTIEREANEYLMKSRDFDIQTYQDYLDRIAEIKTRIANLKVTSATLFPVAGK